MGFDFNKTLSILTYAGLFGLVILNYKGATEVIKALSQAANTYVQTVQGGRQPNY